MNRRTFIKYGVGVSLIPAAPSCRKAEVVTRSAPRAASASANSSELVHNSRFHGIPLTVSKLATTGDFARDTEQIRTHALDVLNDGAFSRLRVRGGGHSYIGASVARSAYTLDLSPFDTIAIDPGEYSIRVGPGCRFHHVYDRLAALGSDLFVASGDCPTVGVVGYTLGGGASSLSPQLGLSVDRVTRATILVFHRKGSTYEAIPMELTPSSNADLYWAVLGGGAQFGIVTDLTLRFDPLDDFSFYWMTKKTGKAAFSRLFMAWEQICQGPLSSRASSKLQVDNQGNIFVFGIFDNRSTDEERLRELVEDQSAAMEVKPLTPETMYQTVAGCRRLSDCDRTAWTVKPEFFAVKSTLLRRPAMLSAPTLDMISDKLTTNTWADYAYLQFNRWSGKMTTPNPKVSFPHRDFAYECQVYAKTDSPEKWNATRFDSWVDETTALLGKREAAFLNHVNADVADNLAIYLGASRTRLDELKRRYDPDHIFDAFTPAN